MAKFRSLGITLITFLVMIGLAPPAVAYWENGEFPSFVDFDSLKKPFNDPRPFLKGPGGDPKQYLPSEVYDKVTFDVKEMKKAWEGVIGFKAPDVVGKIAPEIKPGVYSCREKEKHPGLKDLMVPIHYELFRRGGPPHAGNYSQIKVVPTRQYYWAIPVIEATKKYEGQSSLDAQGYFIQKSYHAGFPFPRPSGPFKPQQIIYNWFKRSSEGDNAAMLQHYYGFNKDLAMDWDSTSHVYNMKLDGRVFSEPLGFFDDRAMRRGEERQFVTEYITPQDSAGNVISILFYGGRDQQNVTFFYFNQIRRLRKLSAEDTQDPFPGWDGTLDDSYGFGQKLRPDLYPYEYKVIGEREVLLPSYTRDGSLYVDANSGYEWRNLEWERRPVYIVELIQKDPNYLYSKRILYFDKETLLLNYSQSYDQKGRLYRDFWLIWAFLENQGMYFWHWGKTADYVDFHTSIDYMWVHPYANWINRDQMGLGKLMRIGR